jgi:dTMP kinase
MLITLEGLDRTGNTTAWRALRDRYTGAVFTREPTDSWYGEAVGRSIDDEDADPLAELFLYMADHADHLSRVIAPALAEGTTVVSDRYSDSRIAYQAATLADSPIPDPFDYVRSIHEPFSRPPDATLYLDVDPETAAERSGETNKFERADHLRVVREGYERLLAADPDRFVRIDATRPQAAVLADVTDAVDRLLD